MSCEMFFRSIVTWGLMRTPVRYHGTQTYNDSPHFPTYWFSAVVSALLPFFSPQRGGGNKRPAAGLGVEQACPVLVLRLLPHRVPWRRRAQPPGEKVCRQQQLQQHPTQFKPRYNLLVQPARDSGDSCSYSQKSHH